MGANVTPRPSSSDLVKEHVLTQPVVGRWSYTESVMPSEYVELREQDYHIVGSRVTLDSIAYGFRNGESAETLQENFPSLTLEQVYGAIAYYLRHRGEIDAYLMEKHKAFEEARRNQQIPNDLKARIARARLNFARRP